MEKLLIYRDGDVIRARTLNQNEQLTQVRRWKDIEFDVTPSSFMMITWPILLPELHPKAARSILNLIGSRYPFSPGYEELKAVAPELVFSEEATEWVFFGGSFNPWHKGHQSCLDLLPADKTCFILPDRNPFKEITPLEPVVTTITLISKIKFGKHHYLAPTFLLDVEKNPTISWIEKLRRDYPEKKLSLLMGFDSFKQILEWTRGSELVKLLDSLYVVSRLEEIEEHAQVSRPILEAAPDLHINFLGRHAFEYISSTNLRSKS